MNNTPERPKTTPNKQRAMSDKSLKLVKIASIIMGVLIIFGFIGLIFGLQQKLSVTTDAYSEVEISLSQGQKILSVSPDPKGGILLWIENLNASDTKQIIQHIDKSGIVKSQFFITVK
tara:strand:+ start:227 stop:580 length:354 start_codon:yes stop_codon:yes gene_type:complete